MNNMRDSIRVIITVTGIALGVTVLCLTFVAGVSIAANEIKSADTNLVRVGLGILITLSCGLVGYIAGGIIVAIGYLIRRK